MYHSSGSKQEDGRDPEYEEAEGGDRHQHLGTRKGSDRFPHRERGDVQDNEQEREAYPTVHRQYMQGHILGADKGDGGQGRGQEDAHG